MSLVLIITFSVIGYAAGDKKSEALDAFTPWTLSTVTNNDTAQLRYRWFFSFGYGRNREDVEKIKSLVDIGSDHGLNGMVLSSFGLDGITRWDEEGIALLNEIAAHCTKRRIELIPAGFSVGYGGDALRHDRSFAAALPVTIALEAKRGKIVPIPAKNLPADGDLEEGAGNRFEKYGLHDKPGRISFSDTLAVSGRTSIRFENLGANEHGHGRIMQKVAVRPGRVYRFSFKIKTQDLEPVSALRAMVHRDGRTLAELYPAVKPTQDWTEVTLDFINTDETEVSLYAGVWGGTSGRFWLDDLRFYEYGTLSDIVRRPGTPLELRSRDRDVVFVEGKDFEEIECLSELPHIAIPPGSAIKEGEHLALSCYKTASVTTPRGRQTSLCMSNPELYEYWETQAERLHRIIGFKKVFLSMDEIRNGGGCVSCRERNISMAEILGDCIARLYSMFKKIDPEIEVFVWSDMLDPAHNAVDGYYGVVGDFTGSWKHVPKDLTIVCWYHEIRNTSLGFFSRQGFRTFGAAYYDADDLTSTREWLVSLKNTFHSQGIMYTTWRKNYRLLADFGDLVSGIDVQGQENHDR